MWSVLGVLLLIWLGVGLVVGLKVVYLDGFVEEVNEKIDNGEAEISDDLTREMFENVRHNKTFYVAIFTLMGAFSFWGDTKRTFKKKN